MRLHSPVLAARAAVLVALVGLAGTAGCGSGGPKTYPVRGKVDLAGADVAVLAGSTIEAAQDKDPTVRASGTIDPGGRFTLQTLHAGVLRTGAPEGRYQARVILGDDDREALRKAAQVLDPRFLQFQTAGLTFQVPADGEVILKLSRR